jgi:hypothetical protein
LERRQETNPPSAVKASFAEASAKALRADPEHHGAHGTISRHREHRERRTRSVQRMGERALPAHHLTRPLHSEPEAISYMRQIVKQRE